LFPKQKGSYNDLQNTMANLLNFAAFGVPYVGGSLCGYAPETSDQELCARYFQLAVISPLAIMTNGLGSLDFQPINFTEIYRQSVIDSLTQRLSIMTQMRSELRQIGIQGGAWLSPLFANGFSSDA
jgi:alpha-glucosidase (family GH31 glycosyl hydrolase)